MPAKALELLQSSEKQLSQKSARKTRPPLGGTAPKASLLEGMRTEWAAVAEVLTEGSALCSMWGAGTRPGDAAGLGGGPPTGDLLVEDVDTRDHDWVHKSPPPLPVAPDPGFPMAPPEWTTNIANAFSFAGLSSFPEQAISRFQAGDLAGIGRSPPGGSPAVPRDPSLSGIPGAGELSEFGRVFRRGSEGIRGEWVERARPIESLGTDDELFSEGKTSPPRDSVVTVVPGTSPQGAPLFPPPGSPPIAPPQGEAPPQGGRRKRNSFMQY